MNTPRLTGEQDDPVYRVWVDEDDNKLGGVMNLLLQLGCSQCVEAV